MSELRPSYIITAREYDRIRKFICRVCNADLQFEDIREVLEIKKFYDLLEMFKIQYNIETDRFEWDEG